jgi:Toprim-like/Protein of unknown function (DUF3991)
MDNELEDFKTNIDLVDYARQNGFPDIDKKKSCSSSTVLRGSSDKILVWRQDSNGPWFFKNIHDTNHKGTIIDFVQMTTNCNLGDVRKLLRNWSGSSYIEHDDLQFHNPVYTGPDYEKVKEDFSRCSPLGRQHPFFTKRNILRSTFSSVRFSNSLWIDEYNNVVFPHKNEIGITGFEKRNVKFNGFTKDGKRSIWFSKSNVTDKRLFFCESGLDCLSHYQIHNDGRTQYFSLGGELSDDQLNLLGKVFKKNKGKDFCLGFDNDFNGKKYIKKIRTQFPEYNFYDCLPEIEGKDWTDLLI